MANNDRCSCGFTVCAVLQLSLLEKKQFSSDRFPLKPTSENTTYSFQKMEEDNIAALQALSRTAK